MNVGSIKVKINLPFFSIRLCVVFLLPWTILQDSRIGRILISPEERGAGMSRVTRSRRNKVGLDYPQQRLKEQVHGLSWGLSH
jgi:hypothetical protein